MCLSCAWSVVAHRSWPCWPQCLQCPALTCNAHARRRRVPCRRQYEQDSYDKLVATIEGQDLLPQVRLLSVEHKCCLVISAACLERKGVRGSLTGTWQGAAGSGACCRRWAGGKDAEQ